MSMSASDGWRKEVGRESRPLGGHQRATRETIQPSLWDRLVNDLPGLGSEIKDLRQILQSEIDAERLDAMVAGGRRAHRVSNGSQHRAEKEHPSSLFPWNVVAWNWTVAAWSFRAMCFREAVRRDIEALFNVQRFESSLLLTDAEAELVGENPPSLEDFPQVRRSVVNYGVPPFSGRSSRDFDREELAKEITQVLAAFEPRLKEGATKVTVSLGDKSIGLRIDIDALLLTTPAPERLRIRTILDLDNGSARTELKDT